MSYTRENCLDNLQLWLEHDDGYESLSFSPELQEIAANQKLVICGETTGVLEDCEYVFADASYGGALSPGQRRLYEILLSIQESTVYAVTTIGKLAKSQGIENPLACSKRLENLRSLQAISGRKP